MSGLGLASEVEVRSQVSKIGLLCKDILFLTKDEKSQENELKEVIYAVQVCFGHFEGNHISSNQKFAFIYSRTSIEAIYTAAYLCYQAKLNHPIVSEVMLRIFGIHGTFEVIFFNLFTFKRHIYWWDNYLSDTRSVHDWNQQPFNYVDHEESIDLMEYFLSYASMARLKFESRRPRKLWYNNGGTRRRIVDLPMEIGVPLQMPAIGTAIKLGNYQVLLVLLRYGAQMHFEDETDDSYNVVKYIITFLFRSFLRSKSMFLLKIPRISFTCLQYLMRAVPAVNTGNWARFIRRTALSDEDITTFADFLTSEVIPPSRSGTQPPELKHLTRLAIRETLNANWLLPGGIYALGLPRSLEEYLDLLRD